MCLNHILYLFLGFRVAWIAVALQENHMLHIFYEQQIQRSYRLVNNVWEMFGRLRPENV